MEATYVLSAALISEIFNKSYQVCVFEHKAQDPYESWELDLTDNN